jgi:hypothetical protein
MTTSETMTPSSEGNDSSRSLSLDDAAMIDWTDPEEETGTGETEQQSVESLEASEELEADEIEATEPDPETDEGDDEASEDAEDEQGSTPEAADDATVTIDGKALTVAELKKGYFREADYTRHKQVVAEKERNLEALANQVSASVEAVTEFLTKALPQAPDPDLALTNPSEYVRKKALHEKAMAQLANVIEQAKPAKDAVAALTAEQRKEVIQAEDAKLRERFPQVSTPEGRQKFFESAASVAQELGYTPEEIGQATDHRLFALAHYARLGMQAEAARAKAKQKVANVPPVAPNKRPAQVNAQSKRNQEQMRKLARTGSIHDAIGIDFD